jgi:hypothetical protein
MVKINFTIKEEIIIGFYNVKAVEKAKWEAWCCDKQSEEDIRKNKDFVDWQIISFCQNLSKEFIIEFADKIYFEEILDNKNMSQEVKDYCRIFL